MKRRTIAAALLLGLLSAGAGAALDELDKRVSLNLKDATAEEAFRALGRVAGVNITLEPGVLDKDVDLELEDVRVRTILSALCDSLRCRWELVEGDLPTIRVTADSTPGRPPKKPNPASLDQPVDLKVTGADVRDILGTIAEIMSARISLDPEVKGNVTLELDDVPLRELLDTVCSEAGCEWSLDARSGILAIRAKKRG